MKRNYKKYLYLLIAILMLVQIFPINLLGFKAQPVQAVEPETADNTSIANDFYWPIPSGVSLDESGLTITPWLSNDINFDGFSIDGAGRTVINLKLMAYSTSPLGLNNPYIYAQFKVDPRLDAMIDWGASFVGNLNYQTKANPAYTDKEWFAPVFGEKNVYEVDFDNLVKGGSYSGRVWNLPVKLVLKAGYNLDSLTDDYIVQTRLISKKRDRYYARINKTNKIKGYNTYTFSTMVPGKSDISGEAITNRASFIQPPITQSHAIAVFEEKDKKSRLLIYHGHTKHRTPYESIDGGNIGYRISFPRELEKYLADENGVAGYVTIADKNADIYDNSIQVQLPKPDLSPTSKGPIVYEIGTSVFVRKDPHAIPVTLDSSASMHNSYLNRTATGFNNVYTITTFNIDKEKLKADFYGDPKKVIEAFPIRVGFVLDNQDGWSTYTYTADEDITIPAGGKLTIKTDKLFGDSNVNKQLLVRIGGNKGKTFILDSKANEYRGLTAVNTNNSMIFEIPFEEGATIKAGQTVEVFIPVDVAGNSVNLYFNGNDYSSSKQATITTSEKTYPTRYMENAGKIVGAAIERAYLPEINEIFTDSKSYTGYSLHPGSSMYLTDLRDENKKKYEAVVGYAFSGITADGMYKFSFSFDGDNTLPSLKKDMQIPFYNSAAGIIDSAIVREQVQAKIRFTMGENRLYGPDELEGLVEKIAPLTKEYRLNPDGTLNTNYTPSGFKNPEGQDLLRVHELEDASGNKVTTVTVDGREVINFLDHNGKPYDITSTDGKEALLKRQFPIEAELTRPSGKVLLGWTTKKLIDGENGKTAAEQYRDLLNDEHILDDESEWANVDSDTQVYVYNEYSPIDKCRTVYAVWGQPQIRIHSNVSADNDTVYVQDIGAKDVDELYAEPADYMVKLDSLFDENGDIKTGFTKEGYSLVGFSRDPNASVPDVNVTGTGEASDFYLRDGDTFSLVDSGNLPWDETKTYDYNFDIEKGLDLYAVWKPDFTIKVDKVWQDNKGLPIADGSTKYANKLHFALLRGAILGSYGQVLPTENIFIPVAGSIQTYTGGQVVWENLPGYDKKGKRYSYLVVELTNDKEVYDFNAAAAKPDQVVKLTDYGISLEKVEDTSFDPPVITMKKTQISQLTMDENGKVDTFSAATKRLHITDDHPEGTTHHPPGQARPAVGYFDTQGYYTTVYNTQIVVAPPTIRDIYETDKSVVITWPLTEVDKILVTLPDNSTVELKKDADGNYIKSAGTATNIVVTSSGRLATLTYNDDTAFTINQQVKAQSINGEGVQEARSDEIKTTVLKKETSAQPINLAQGVLETTEEGAYVPISFSPGDYGASPPAYGSVYRLMIENASGEYEESQYIFKIDDKNRSDFLHSGATIKVPKTDLSDQTATNLGKNIKIRAEEPNKYTKESDSLAIDLKAPDFIEKQLTDDRFREYFFFVAQLDEVPAENKTYIKVTYEKWESGTENLKNLGTEKKRYRIMRLKYRALGKQIKTIQVTTEDRFGNVNSETIDYTNTKELVLDIQAPRAEKSYIKVSGPADTIVTITVKRDGQEIASGKVTLDTKDTMTKINLMANIEPYVLKSGDEVHIYGEEVGNTNNYTNPKIFIIY